MNDRMKLWGRALGILGICIIVSFVILHFRVDSYPYIVAAWAFAIVCGLPGLLTFSAARNFRNTLRCYRQGATFPGTCTGVRYRARERLYVVEWENADGLQEEEFTTGVGLFPRPPFPVTVYELDETRCLGKGAVIETGFFVVLFLLIQIGAAIPVILIICDLCR